MIDVGQTINALGVRARDFPEGALVTDAVIILKYVDEDGEAVIWQGQTDSSSWIEVIGMLRVALVTEEASMRQRP